MKILVTGGYGLVGSHFVENSRKYLDSNNIILYPNSDELNITDQTSVNNFLKLHNPDAIIHFAAYTDVSKAEKERNQKEAPCWNINVDGTANLVKAAERKQIYFIHISTDLVFSGDKDDPGPYPENHPAEENLNLLSWYGWTKLQAEKIILGNLKNSAILRIANPVRSMYKEKLDYVHKILELFDKGKLYPMFDDQYLTLTYINEVTKTLAILLKNRSLGIYHVSSSNVFTPYKLAELLIEKARGKKGQVKSSSINDSLQDNFSRYPQYGGLKVENTEKKLHTKFRPWEVTIEILARQL